MLSVWQCLTNIEIFTLKAGVTLVTLAVKDWARCGDTQKWLEALALVSFVGKGSTEEFD